MGEAVEWLNLNMGTRCYMELLSTIPLLSEVHLVQICLSTCVLAVVMPSI